MRVGAASIDITPDFTTELSGYALREQPAAGVLAPIFARAVYIVPDRSAADRLLWITCDVIAFERAFIDDLRAWAKRELSLDSHQVLLAATHTHFAPGTIELCAAGARSERFIELLAARVRHAAADAIARAEPCDLVTAHGELPLGVDRRKKPTSHVDPAVWAVGFRRRRDGEFAAAILNYTMHPVSHGHSERRISPDWCGFACARASDQLPGRPVVMVTNGAAGNIDPPQTNLPRDAVEAFGRSIADAVVPALAAAPAQPHAPLAVRSVVVPIELDWQDEATIKQTVERFLAESTKYVWGDRFRQALLAWREAMTRAVAAGLGRTLDIELQAAHIGDVIALAVNGEMFSRFTDDVRRAAGEANLFTVAYANSAFGYIPTREAYAEGGYEVETAHFFYKSFRPKAGTLELLAQRAAELVRAVRTTGT